MAKQSRVNLKANFQTGFKPTEQNFADLIDSFISLEDDFNNSDLKISGGLKLGDSTTPEAGTLRWNSSTNSFEAYDGTSWNVFGSGGGGGGVWQESGNDISYQTGNVAVGTAGTPSRKFEVELGEDTGEDQQVKIGRTIVANGSGSEATDAFIGNSNGYDSSEGQYAIRMEASGTLRLNSPTASTRVSLCTDGQEIVVLRNNTLGVGTNNPSSVYSLFVAGRAYTTSSLGMENPSDERLKKDIKEFNDGLEIIKKINPKTFKFNGLGGTKNNENGIGVIAQEIEKICPYTVNKTKAPLKETDKKETELLSFSANPLIYVAINAIKELSARVEELEKKLG